MSYHSKSQRKRRERKKRMRDLSDNTDKAKEPGFSFLKQLSKAQARRYGKK